MTRVRHVNLVLLIAGLLFLLTASLPFVTTATAQGQNNAKSRVKSQPETHRRTSLPTGA